jgi:glyceraldehyde-3-phosphate dehydrogenase (ferredoxin)
MVPNQYWAPGLFAPMPIMGKYFEYYGSDFLPPLELGRRCAERMVRELYSDNGGFCRFHRGWVEKILPELVSRHFGEPIDFEAHHRELARRIQAGNRSMPWETARTIDLVHRYLLEAESEDPELARWQQRFEENRDAAAREFWEQIRQGVEEVLGPPSADTLPR